MKKVVFICSHLYSGSDALYESMNLHQKIQGFKSYKGNIYESPLHLLRLCENIHKINNRSAVYLDNLVYNYQISTKSVYDYCKFIYVLTKPEHVINSLISIEKKKVSHAINYYNFRLRRICEMAKRTPGAIFLTFEDMAQGKGMNLISDYLELREPVEFNPLYLAPFQKTFSTDLLGSVLRSQVEDTYERYLYFLKNQLLLRPQ